MKCTPSSNSSHSSAAFAPLPFAPSHTSSHAGDSPQTQFRRPPYQLRRRKVVWDTSPVQHPVTAEVLRCPTPVFLHVEPVNTLKNLISQKNEEKATSLSTIRRTKPLDTSKFYRFSKFPPYLSYTVGRKQSLHTPKSTHRFGDLDRAVTPQDPATVLSNRPHSIFLELKSQRTASYEPRPKLATDTIHYRQADIRSLRTIKQELRYLQKLREETYDKAVDDVLNEYQLNSIMDDELSFMNKEGNLFAKYLDGQADATSYFDTVKALK